MAHPLPPGFKLTPDLPTTTALPVTPVIPPTVANGDVITSLHENLSLAALTDLWTNEQWLEANRFVDPTSVKGDILVRDANILTRLPVGVSGQVLTADSAAMPGIKWAAVVAGVSSVFGRTGAIVSATGDYTAAQVTNAVSTLGSYADPAWITSLAYSKITGVPAPPVVPVASVFGRTGAVVAVAGDYTAAQVTNAVSVLGSYADPAWISSLAYSKITGAPASVPTSRQVIAGAGLSGGGALTADVTLSALVMGASGPASHRAGMVPDPGATTGAGRYLREDATWALPSGAGGGLTDPTTTTGDLLVRGPAAVTRLGVGTNGQALVADSSQTLGVKWATVAGGGGAAQTPWTSHIDAAFFNLNKCAGIGIGTTGAAMASANTGVLVDAFGIYDALRQLNGNADGWSGCSFQNDTGRNLAFRVYGSARATPDSARIESSGALDFVISAIDVLRLSLDGKVGVKKVPTTYPLEVFGDIDITGTYRVNGAPLYAGQTPWQSDINAAGYKLVNVNAVGINVATAVPLHVHKGVDDTDAAIVSGADTTKYMSFSANANAGRIMHWNGTGFGNIVLGPSGGNVGIGSSSSPYAKLTINGAVASDTPGSFHQLAFTWADVAIFGWRIADANNALVLDALGGVGWASSITVMRNTNRVGIAKAAMPAYTLDVAGDINTTGVFRVNGVPFTGGGAQTPWTSNIDAAGFALSNASSVACDGTLANVKVASYPGFGMGVQSGQLTFAAGTPSSLMSIHSSGFVGIGIATQAPFANLQVTGAGQATATPTFPTGQQGATLLLGDNGGAAGNGGMILFGANTNSAFAGIKGYFTNGTGNGQGNLYVCMRVAAADATLTPIITIESSGKMLCPAGYYLAETISLVNGAPWYGMGASSLGTQLAGWNGVNLQTSGTNLCINAAGHVGIGTLTPNQNRFSVIPTSYCTNNYNSVAYAMRIGEPSNNSAYGLQFGFNNINALWVGTIQSSPAQHIVMQPLGGNVGIGGFQAAVANIAWGVPQNLLTIVGHATPTDMTKTSQQVMLCEGSNNPGYGLGLGFGPYAGGVYSGAIQSWHNGGAGWLYLQPSGGYVMVCRPSNTSPRFALEVGVNLGVCQTGTTFITMGQDVAAAPANVFYGGLFWDGQSGGSLRLDALTQSVKWHNISMAHNAASNVGIGLGLASWKLQLFVDSAAKPSTSTWTNPSDVRIKRNVRDLVGGLDIISKLHPVVAEYNGLGGTVEGLRTVGFLAHEIREVLPTTVASIRRKLRDDDTEETDILGFNLHEVLIHLVLAVQQLAAQVAHAKGA